MDMTRLEVYVMYLWIQCNISELIGGHEHETCHHWEGQDIVVEQKGRL